MRCPYAGDPDTALEFCLKLSGLKLTPLFWTAPLLLYAADSHAWGLYTHMYFTQHLIWFVPLADPRFRRAIRRFPELCLAATCLPDVSLFCGWRGNAALRSTHQWSSVLRMLREARGDADRAMAMGYACHLMTDIVAHNYFVPTHERLWFRGRILTHAAAEWAMDAHIAPHLLVRPATLIGNHRERLVDFACRRLHVVPETARRALGYLSRGESALRFSRVPQLLYGASRRADRALTARFDEYVRETSGRLIQIDRLIHGEIPAWLPELDAPVSSSRRAKGPRHEPYLALLPADLFCNVGPR